MIELGFKFKIVGLQSSCFVKLYIYILYTHGSNFYSSQNLNNMKCFS